MTKPTTRITDGGLWHGIAGEKVTNVLRKLLFCAAVTTFALFLACIANPATAYAESEPNNSI